MGEGGGGGGGGGLKSPKILSQHHIKRLHVDGLIE